MLDMSNVERKGKKQEEEKSMRNVVKIDNPKSLNMTLPNVCYAFFGRRFQTFLHGKIII